MTATTASAAYEEAADSDRRRSNVEPAVRDEQLRLTSIRRLPTQRQTSRWASPDFCFGQKLPTGHPEAEGRQDAPFRSFIDGGNHPRSCCGSFEAAHRNETLIAFVQPSRPAQQLSTRIQVGGRQLDKRFAVRTGHNCPNRGDSAASLDELRNRRNLTV